MSPRRTARRDRSATSMSHRVAADEPAAASCAELIYASLKIATA